MRVPTYLDGKPANLQAAIIDAMYWLRVLRSRLYDEPQLPLTELREHQTYLRLAIEPLQKFLPEEAAETPAKAPRGTIKARYCKVCFCELDEFNLAKQGDHTCRKCKEAGIKEKLRAKQQAMRAADPPRGREAL